jgi:site-specific DNA recombinase
VVIGRITLPPQVVDRAVKELQSSDSQEAELHQQAIARLEREDLRLNKRLEGMYMDKLNGVIDADFYHEHSGEWKNARARIQSDIELHRAGGRHYVTEAANLLELAQHAQNLYDRQSPREKRRLLKFVVSNCTWKEGVLNVKYRQPFDLFATWQEVAKNPPDVEGGGNGQNEKWLLR